MPLCSRVLLFSKPLGVTPMPDLTCIARSLSETREVWRVLAPSTPNPVGGQPTNLSASGGFRPHTVNTNHRKYQPPSSLSLMALSNVPTRCRVLRGALPHDALDGEAHEADGLPGAAYSGPCCKTHVAFFLFEPTVTRCVSGCW